MNDQHLRIGDAERATAAADLGEHFAQGRLTADEHAERSELIWSARTRSDLTPVFADLPGPYADGPVSAGTSTRVARPGPRRARHGWPMPIVVVLGLLVLFTAVTHVPVIAIGLLVFWFVAHRHGPHRRGRRC